MSRKMLILEQRILGIPISFNKLQRSTLFSDSLKLWRVLVHGVTFRAAAVSILLKRDSNVALTIASLLRSLAQ